ncbi:MAG: hypothetical protein JSV53_03275, partial [candidate division WOR-3 bacterium]
QFYFAVSHATHIFSHITLRSSTRSSPSEVCRLKRYEVRIEKPIDITDYPSMLNYRYGKS